LRNWEQVQICSVFFLYTLYIENQSSFAWARVHHNHYSHNHRTYTNIERIRFSFTHVNILHLVTSLPTSRQQVVFALLVPSCQQVWNKLLTTCNNLVDIIVFVARLFQQVRCSHDITILLQSCIVNLATFLLYHDCIRLVRTTLLQVW
jgi:hypothetical protein